MGTARTLDEDPTDLRRMSRPPTGSSVDTPQLIMSTLGWVRKAVSCEAATVQVLLPDEVRTASRVRGRRRSGHGGQAPLRSPPSGVRIAPAAAHPSPRDHRDRPIGVYPLVVDDDAIGVLEVIAPSRNLEERHEVHRRRGRSVCERLPQRGRRAGARNRGAIHEHHARASRPISCGPRRPRRPSDPPSSDASSSSAPRSWGCSRIAPGRGGSSRRRAASARSGA